MPLAQIARREPIERDGEAAEILRDDRADRVRDRAEPTGHGPCEDERCRERRGERDADGDERDDEELLQRLRRLAGGAIECGVGVCRHGRDRRLDGVARALRLFEVRDDRRIVRAAVVCGEDGAAVRGERAQRFVRGGGLGRERGIEGIEIGKDAGDERRARPQLGAIAIEGRSVAGVGGAIGGGVRERDAADRIARAAELRDRLARRRAIGGERCRAGVRRLRAHAPDRQGRDDEDECPERHAERQRQFPTDSESHRSLRRWNSKLIHPINGGRNCIIGRS